MTGEIFYWILNMSISAAIVGMIVLLLGRIRRIPRRIACVLWIVPFIRMTVPFGMGSRFSLMTLISKFTTRTVVIPESINGLTMTNYVMAANSYFPITYKVNILENVFSAASLIWIVVTAAVLLTFAAIYRITVHELKDAVLLHDNIYVSDKVTSPAVYGIFRPRVILPTTYSEDDLPYILAHETCHIARCDNLRRVLAFLITAVHWFNPLAWLFLREYLAQTELACDESVLRGFEPEERKKYALVLVNAAGNREMFASAFGGAKVRLRVSHILSYRKLSALSICAFAVLAGAIVGVLLTNAV